MVNAWKIYYYIDFLSKYFNFSFLTSSHIQKQAWSSLLKHKGLSLLLIRFLSQKKSKKVKFEDLEQKVLKFSQEVYVIFNQKINCKHKKPLFEQGK